MQSQPMPTTPTQAAACGLATVSLVLGVFGVLFGPLAGIPAIITGHLALRRIRKSRGALQGRGKALVGLVLGYGLTALFAYAGFAAADSAIATARKVTVLSTATAIESAVNNYYTEYGKMPTNEPSDTTISTSQDAAFLHVLLGLESKVNLRAVKFLSVREGRDNKNGLIYGKDGKSVDGLFDAWGGGYHVRLDLDLDEKIHVNGKVLENRRVAVWSDGPDRKPGTADDIKTWE